MDEVAKSTGQEIDKIRYSLLGKVEFGLFCLRQTLKFRFLSVNKNGNIKFISKLSRALDMLVVYSTGRA